VKEKEIELVIDLIDEVLSNIENEIVIIGVKNKVNDLMKNYPLFA
jgi:glycine hydroxymethyltransferase